MMKKVNLNVDVVKEDDACKILKVSIYLRL